MKLTPEQQVLAQHREAAVDYLRDLARRLETAQVSVRKYAGQDDAAYATAASQFLYNVARKIEKQVKP